MNNFSFSKFADKYTNSTKNSLTIAVVGLLLFIIAASTLPFKDRLLSLLFPKYASKAASITDWNQVQKDPQRTGYTQESLGTNFAVKWTYAFQPERVHPQVQAIVYDDGASTKVFVGTEMGNMYAIDASTGGKKWLYNTGSPILSSVAADNGKVYFGAMNGMFYAINTSDGTEAWKVQLSTKGISSSPLLADGKVMVGGRDGKFYALDPNGGGKMWEYNANSPILMTPAFSNGKAFFGTLDMNVHAVTTANGSSSWKTQLFGSAFKDYWPIVSNGKVIIKSYPRDVYQAGLRPGFPFQSMSLTNAWVTQNGPLLANGSATLATNFMSAQDNIVASYNANPSTYNDKKSLFILDENTGSESYTVPHFDVQTLAGTAIPGCIDRDGKLVAPIEIIDSGWGRMDLTLGRFVDVLYDGGTYANPPRPNGMGNNDENLAPTCTSNMVISAHLEEGNANYTGYWDMDKRTWSPFALPGSVKREMSTNNQHPTDPVSVSNGMVYHIAWHVLIARQPGPGPTPTPTATPAAGVPLGDVTASLQNLGNPSKARYPADNDNDEYARNVWDMQVFNGRIYIGSGNSSNFAPRSNAGPVDLWYYDFSSNQFIKDTSNGQACGTDCIDDEQIDKIKIIDNTLYIPGHDPKNNGAPGMFRIEGGVWKKIPTSFDLHNYDVYKYQNKLFASGASNTTLPLMMSSDNGASWQSAADATILNGRYYSLFEMGGSLYGYLGIQLAKYNGTNFTSVCLDLFGATCGMLPGTTPSGAGGGRIEKSLVFNGQTVYAGGYSVNDHQWDPKGLFKATSETDATKLTLPNNALPRDLLIDGSTIYVVAHTGTSGSMTNYVFSSTDLTTWTEVLRFTHETFARSFEYTNGYFYFGMGTDVVTPLPNLTGDILRVKYP